MLLEEPASLYSSLFCPLSLSFPLSLCVCVYVLSVSLPLYASLPLASCVDLLSRTPLHPADCPTDAVPYRTSVSRSPALPLQG